MLLSDSYFTIQKEGNGLYKDKGSKFIGYAYPVNTEQEIKEQIALLKKEHVGARHFCYAWRLGPDKQNWRVNDDGEPGNSAGKPIYSQIVSNDLTNILIVVVRYFGGTLLGVSGLIHAYKEAASEALKACKKKEVFILCRYKLVFPIEDISTVMKLCKDFEAAIISQDFAEEYTLIIEIKKALESDFLEKMKAIYTTKHTFLNIIA
jgi:uncharacterized YigZ family protein